MAYVVNCCLVIVFVDSVPMCMRPCIFLGLDVSGERGAESFQVPFLVDEFWATVLIVCDMVFLER